MKPTTLFSAVLFSLQIFFLIHAMETGDVGLLQNWPLKQRDGKKKLSLVSKQDVVEMWDTSRDEKVSDANLSAIAQQLAALQLQLGKFEGAIIKRLDVLEAEMSAVKAGLKEVQECVEATKSFNMQRLTHAINIVQSTKELVKGEGNSNNAGNSSKNHRRSQKNFSQSKQTKKLQSKQQAEQQKE